MPARVSHGNLFGFVEVEDIVFGERSTVVVDPAEERLKSEFAGVKRTQYPAACRHPHRRGREAGRQQDQRGMQGDNVTQFPTMPDVHTGRIPAATIIQ